MNCPFCAEVIQDAAVVCRFCGAAVVDARWQRPAVSVAPRAPTGTFTLRFAGAAFGLSAFLELVSIDVAVPMFGALRSGAVAWLYHATYVALFVGLFVGLYQSKRWAYRLLLAGTCFYTLDNVRYVLDEAGMMAQLRQKLSLIGGTRGLVDEASMQQTMLLAVLFCVACWWGFVLYVRRRRDVLTG